MRVVRKFSFGCSIVVASALISVTYASQREAAPKTRIKNFGCVSEKLYRGAQPEGRDYQDLAALGVKTVIDLQREGESDEAQLVEAAGMKFFRIPMSDKSWPSVEAAQQFLNLVGDQANQPVFVHCRGGRHRTGIMTAIYRLTTDGWTADRAFAEMKQYDFEHGYGHGTLKDYVYDYYTRMSHKGVVADSSK